jgi:hypothetical protein
MFEKLTLILITASGAIERKKKKKAKGTPKLKTLCGEDSGAASSLLPLLLPFSTLSPLPYPFGKTSKHS